MLIKQIYDASLSQYAYLIGCQRSGEALLVDPQRDIDRYQSIASENNLKITSVAETHIHADFLSGVREFLHSDSSLKAYLSDEGDADWKYEWAKTYSNVELLTDGDEIQIGKIVLKALHTPGHTPEHLSFLVTDRGGGANEPMAILTGDFVFVGDVGRPDLLESAVGQVGSQEGAARILYQSILHFTELPEYIQILPGHGAGSACGKALGAIPSSTVGYEKRFNSAVKTALEEGEDAFVTHILAGQPEPPVFFARMKHENKEGVSVLNTLPRPVKLSAKQFIHQGGRPESVILDSSRGRRDFMDNHLRGALLTPTGGAYSIAAGSYVEPKEQIYLLLEHESDLQEAIRSLIRIGLDEIVGYLTWAELMNSEYLAASLVATPRAEISSIDLLRRECPEVQVLDVRSAGEYGEGHVDGAQQIAYTRLASQIHSLSSTPYLVHCGSGSRASLAVPYLERKGVVVTYLEGLYSDYESCSTPQLGD